MQVDDTTVSYLRSARELIGQNDFKGAARNVESAVDLCWKYADEKIAFALPLLSYISHSTGNTSNLFDELDDLPCELSRLMVSEATKLDSEFGNDASAKVVSEVNQFVVRLHEKSKLTFEMKSKSNLDDEKLAMLKDQIRSLEQDGNTRLALETRLELANEYILRQQNLKALDLFRKVLKQAWRQELVDLRVDGLLEFGRFFLRLERLDDAEHVLRLAAGVAKKSRQRERYAYVIADLGVVLAHGKQESAEKYLQKAKEMLGDGNKSLKVQQHLDALRSGRSCQCDLIQENYAIGVAGWN